MIKDIFILGLLLVLPLQALTAQEEEVPSSYEVGAFSLTVFPEMQQNGKESILIGASDEMRKEYLPEGTYPTAINAFMLETPDNTLLFDAGLGQKLFAHLEHCGKKPEDIDMIMLTHLHGDHIGGLMKEGERAFPSATLYVPQPEYDYWMDEKIMSALPENQQRSFLNARKVLNAYKEQLHLFVPAALGEKGEELIPGIQGMAAYGHTPGHTVYQVESEGQQLLVWGDIAHALAIQIPCPQVAVTYDVDPAQAIVSREKVLRYVAENNMKVAGMHIVYPGIGQVRGDQTRGYSFNLICTCEGFFR